jgi:predicted acylesterase/phospholipase RssA
LYKLVVEGFAFSKNRSWWRKGLSLVALPFTLWRIWRRLKLHIKNRGFFHGTVLEKEIEKLLRTVFEREGGLRLPEGDVPKPGDPLRFRHFTKLAEKNKAHSYRPPLLITATNLSYRRLEVISSIDPAYQNVSIAQAVRASAGFPVFFRPVEVSGSKDGGWFVDGGVVSNYPAWVFSDAFRAQVAKSPMFLVLSGKPWIRIGLRAVEDPPQPPDLKEPKYFFGSLVGMLTGQARNQLEELLSKTAPRSLVVKQPVSKIGGPSNVLAMHELTVDKIIAMVTLGREYAQKQLQEAGSPSIYRSGIQEAEVVKQLQALVRRCELILGANGPQAKLRANVFLPRKERMKLVYQVNMDGHPDREMEFSDHFSGLTGFCYLTRRPMIANLETIRRLVQDHGEENLFGMPPDLQAKVQKDRTWLASVPVFDPYELRVTPRELKPSEQQLLHRGAAYKGIETRVDGPFLGILNLDAGFVYASFSPELDPRPSVHFEDERIQAIISIMQSTSLRLAEILVAEFGPVLPGSRPERKET